jgi:hypothetical protein
VATTLTNLGNAYGSLGDTQKSRELLERALAINERHYGPDHPNVSLLSFILFSVYKFDNTSFDGYKFIVLAMDVLIKFKGTKKETCSIHLCETVIKTLSIIEKSKIGSNPVYMETLLDIVRRSLQLVSEQDNIENIKCIFSILITLTDEMPKTCELFVEKGGIDLCFIILSVSFIKFDKWITFSIQRFIIFQGIFDQKSIQTLVILLLSNVAEVSHLRNFMMNSEFISILR